MIRYNEEESEAEFRVRAAHGSLMLLRRLRKFHKVTQPKSAPKPDKPRTVTEWALDRAKSFECPVDRIKHLASSYYHVPFADLAKSNVRDKTITDARQVAMSLIYRFTRQPYRTIAPHFGCKDHTTILWAIKKVGKRAEYTPALAALSDAYVGLQA